MLLHAWIGALQGSRVPMGHLCGQGKGARWSCGTGGVLLQYCRRAGPGTCRPCSCFGLGTWAKQGAAMCYTWGVSAAWFGQGRTCAGCPAQLLNRHWRQPWTGKRSLHAGGRDPCCQFRHLGALRGQHCIEPTKLTAGRLDKGQQPRNCMCAGRPARRRLGQLGWHSSVNTTGMAPLARAFWAQ